MLLLHYSHFCAFGNAKIKCVALFAFSGPMTHIAFKMKGFSSSVSTNSAIIFSCNLDEMMPSDHICDWIWENPPYGICEQFAQCAVLVAQAEICRSPDFVIYMSNNPSTICCRLLRRLVVLYEGEISLHFDPPSRHSRHTRSPLLWALKRILYLHSGGFIKLLYFRSPF